MPGSIRASVNDAIVEDLIENRLAGLAHSLAIDEPRWKAQTSFDPARLSEARAAAQRGVEDAKPRMSLPDLKAEQSLIDELLGEVGDDA
jgi:hypothetical protein